MSLLEKSVILLIWGLRLINRFYLKKHKLVFGDFLSIKSFKILISAKYKEEFYDSRIYWLVIFFLILDIEYFLIHIFIEGITVFKIKRLRIPRRL